MPNESYTWRAVYDDSTVVKETDVETFAAVDPARCIGVEIWRRNWAGEKRVLTVDVDPSKGQRAVFARRRRVIFSLAGAKQERELIATIVGWENTNGASYLFLSEDGRMLMTSDMGAM